tara:strand:- start:6832 stop:7353 length:522 start_codon:yes stop_codon:yes gene_type:complete
MGGTDDPSNIKRMSIEEHAEAHLKLYEEHGLMQDHVAYRMLLGQIDKAQAIKLLQKAPKSERWKQTMRERNTGEGNPMYGKTQTNKQKEAVSVANSVPKPHLSKLYKERYANGTHTLPDTSGALNGMSAKIRVGDIVYDTMNECAKAHGVSRVTVRNRILSQTDRFIDWEYGE